MRKVYCLTQTTLFPSSQKENGYQKCKKTSHLLAQKSMATIMKNKPCDCRLYSYVLSHSAVMYRKTMITQMKQLYGICLAMDPHKCPGYSNATISVSPFASIALYNLQTITPSTLARAFYFALYMCHTLQFSVVATPRIKVVTCRMAHINLNSTK